MAESIKELTAMGKSNKITSDQVLSQTKKVEVQGVQKAILDTTKESRVWYDKEVKTILCWHK